MADDYVQINADGSGKKVDNDSLTVGANLVYRQRVRLAGANAASLADVVSTVLVGTELGLVTRAISCGQAASGSAVAGNPNLCGGSDGTNARTFVTDTTGNQAVVGNVASGVADAGNPVKVGGYASSAAPTAVTAGQRANAWFYLNGQTVAVIGDFSSPNTIARVTSPSDAQGSVTALATLALPSLYNGSSTDRQRGNTDLSLLASAARTATTASADQTNYNGRGVRLVLSVTAASGTGGLQAEIQGKDSISGAYFQLNTDPAAVTATGTYVYDLYPSTLSAAANGITQATQALLSRTWRVNVKAGDASSYTYSVSAVTIL